MRKILVILFISSLISCSSYKEIEIETDYKDLKIVETTKVNKKDTIILNELRFYEIDAAYDTMKLMFLDFGEWNYQENGMHKERIYLKVWENIKLFDNDETFTIIADGTESKKDYFACLIVFDSKGQDCLNQNHPLKKEIINFFYERMKVNRKKKINYLLLK